MKLPICDLSAQYDTLRDEVRTAMDEVLESGAFILGPQVARLEAEVAAFCGCARGVGVASGTDALRLMLAAAGVGQGHEVVTSAFTFVATGSAISRCGATPVFADISPDTYNLNPEAVARAISPRTRAILAVHLYGQTCDMDALRALADEHGLLLLEDAAQAIGATWGGVSVGALADGAALSFFPTKNLGAYGDGGMVVTNSDELATKVDILRRQGAAKKYRSGMVGLNSRLDTLQAAVLLVKLKYLAGWNRNRQSAAALYTQLLQDLPVKCPVISPNAEHVFHQYTIATNQRDQLAAHLSAASIGNMIYYPVPLHLQGLYRHLGYAPGSLPHTEAACEQVISLPMFPELTPEQGTRVVEEIGSFLRN